MDKKLNDYLETVDRYLKPLEASERVDIVTELKSGISELQNSDMTADEIIDRLGDPKELANAYLGDSIAKDYSFDWKKIRAIALFYALAGTAWMFVLPLTGALSAGLMCSGAILPIAGAVKYIGSLFGYDIEWITVNIGSYVADATTVLPISIAAGAVLFGLGRLMWMLTVKIIKGLSATKAKMRQA